MTKSSKIVTVISFLLLIAYASSHVIPKCQNSTEVEDEFACILLANCNYTMCGMNALTGDTQWFKNLCVMQIYNWKCMTLFLPAADAECTTPKPTSTSNGLCLVPNILDPNIGK